MSNSSPFKRRLYTGVVALGLAIGSVGIAAAASNGTSDATAPADNATAIADSATVSSDDATVSSDDATVSSDDATVSSDDDFAENSEPPFTGSIQGPVEEDSLSEADETAQLESLATISADEATAAAISAVPGEIGEVELENEHGSVVYSVEITDAAGARTKVIVDAGNAEILSQLTKDGNDKGDHQDDEVEGADDGTENEARHSAEANEANEDSEPGDS